MRLSTLAALLILTTMMLSLTACAQDQMAELVDHSGQRYTTQPPKYSEWNPAPKDPNTSYKYQSSSEQYGVEAEVGSVSTTDLPPPAANATPASSLAPQHGSALEQKPAVQQAAEPMPAAQPVAVAAAPAPVAAPVHENVDLGDAKPSFRWPAQGQLLTRFGPQSSGATSDGIAIGTPQGMPIHAAAGGQVAYVGDALKGYGNMVILRHSGGYMTSYAHASAISVQKGDVVKAGQVIGYVGKSGNVASPQLHFTVREQNKTVDPLRYLPSQVASN